MRSLPIRLLAVLLLLTASPAGATEPGTGAPPIPCPDCNVLLISIDTLRADHLSVYGYERPTSPHLEALAADAVVFEQVFNHGTFTLPEHISMFTSLPPNVQGSGASTASSSRRASR